MPRRPALLDTNVIVAALVDMHQHHTASYALFAADNDAGYCVAAHSYAEAFDTLTRQGPRAPVGRTASAAWAALESVAAVTTLVGLTPAQTFDAVRRYAGDGNTGARVYDRLIGQAAVQARATTIVTWNVGQFRDLFPDLRVATPMELLAASG